MGVVWDQDWALLTTLLPTPFSLPHLTPGPLGGPQAQLPYLGAFSPARSHHAPSGSQAPSLPPGVLCGPHISPSTSALSLVLSHGDGRKESQHALAGPHRMPTKALGWGGEGEVDQPCPPLKGKAGHAQWGLGPTLHHWSQEAEAKAPATLRATETGWGLAWAMLLSSSPLLLPVLTVVINPRVVLELKLHFASQPCVG